MAESINLARCKGECGEAVSLVLLQRLRPFLFFSYTEDDMMTIPYHMVAPAGGAPTQARSTLILGSLIAGTWMLPPQPRSAGWSRGTLDLDKTVTGVQFMRHVRVEKRGALACVLTSAGLSRAYGRKTCSSIVTFAQR